MDTVPSAGKRRQPSASEPEIIDLVSDEEEDTPPPKKPRLARDAPTSCNTGNLNQLADTSHGAAKVGVHASQHMTVLVPDGPNISSEVKLCCTFPGLLAFAWLSPCPGDNCRVLNKK